MITYIYAGKVFCEACGLAIRRRITETPMCWLVYPRPSNPGNPWSYDSNDFPKGPYYAHYKVGIPDLLCGSEECCLQGGAVVGSEYDSESGVPKRDPWTDVDASLL